ncbi:MAG: AMP-binding protein, partial [Nocardioidaceae bacterium]
MSASVNGRLTVAAPQTTVRDRYAAGEIAAYYESGFWQPSSFYGLVDLQARARPDKTFVVDSTTSLSYAEFRERALRLAVGLRQRGIEAGDRVAVQLPNFTEFPLLAVALSRLSAITVPIMPIYRDDEVKYVLQHSGAVAAVTCQTFRGFDHLAMFARVMPECADLRLLLAARATAELDSGVATPLTELMAEGDEQALEVE